MRAELVYAERSDSANLNVAIWIVACLFEARSGMSSGIELIQQNLEAIRALAKEYDVARLEVFGSVCTSEFDPATSDVDFLVEYPEGYDFGPWLGRYQDLQAALADLLECKVDLVMIPALRNKWFRKEAEKTRRVIYDASTIAEVA
jgi:predicted nucleotidyltransferase